MSGSAPDSAGGSDAIQTCLRSSASVSLSPHVHFAAVANHGCPAMASGKATNTCSA